MALEVKCDRCPTTLDEPGALVFSPPLWGTKVMKLHICMACWANLLHWIRSGAPAGGES